MPDETNAAGISRVSDMVKRAYLALWIMAKPEFGAASRLLRARKADLVPRIRPLFLPLNEGAEDHLFQALIRLGWLQIIHEAGEQALFRFRIDPKTWKYLPFLPTTHQYDGYEIGAVYRDLCGVAFQATARRRRWTDKKSRPLLLKLFESHGFPLFLTMLLTRQGATSDYRYDTDPVCWRPVVACLFELERRGLVRFLGSAEEPYQQIILLGNRLDEAPEYTEVIASLLIEWSGAAPTPTQTLTTRPDTLLQTLIAATAPAEPSQEPDDEEESENETPLNEADEQVLDELEKAATQVAPDSDDRDAANTALRDIRDMAISRVAQVVTETYSSLCKTGESIALMHARHERWLDEGLGITCARLRKIARALEQAVDPSRIDREEEDTDDNPDTETETLLELRLAGYIEEHLLHRRVYALELPIDVKRRVAESSRVGEIAKHSLAEMGKRLAARRQSLDERIITCCAAYEAVEERLFVLQELVDRLSQEEMDEDPHPELERARTELAQVQREEARLAREHADLSAQIAELDEV